jgi:hypothetical protein
MAFAVVAASALYLVAPSATYAAKVAAPSLDFVPADGYAVISIRVADIWERVFPKVKPKELEKALPGPLQQFRRYVGVGLGDVDRLTAFVPAPGKKPSAEPLLAVTTIKPCDKKVILTTVTADASYKKIHESKNNGHVLYDILGAGTGLAFLDDHTFVVSKQDTVERFLEAKKANKEGPMAPVLKLVDKHLVAAGADMAALAKSFFPLDQLPPDKNPLLKARLAVLTVDLDDSLRGKLKLAFDTAEEAKEGTAALDAGMGMFRDQFAEGAARFCKQVNSPKLTALLDDVQTALKAAKAEQKGATVEAEAALKIDPDAITAALTESLPLIENAAKRIQLANDLKQLSLASMNYADANGGRMPTDVYDKNGKPLLSWRVAVLPYIEGGNLYSQFRLDEPWDSEHNKKLLEKMPETFAPKNTEAYKNHETFFQAFVGKGTIFERSGLRFPADIPDGTSNTILFVEAKKAVPWTKPADIPFDAGMLLPKVGGLTKGGFMAAMCDGSVHFIPLTVKEETLRTWIIRDSDQVRPALDK